MFSIYLQRKTKPTVGNFHFIKYADDTVSLELLCSNYIAFMSQATNEQLVSVMLMPVRDSILWKSYMLCTSLCHFVFSTMQLLLNILYIGHLCTLCGCLSSTSRNTINIVISLAGYFDKCEFDSMIESKKSAWDLSWPIVTMYLRSSNFSLVNTKQSKLVVW